MDTLWQRVRLWARVVILGLVVLYIGVFIYQNAAKPTEFWWWYERNQQTNVLALTSIAFAAGCLVTLLARTIYRTLRQFKEMTRRSKTDRLEREIAEMKSKAAMLKTRDSTSPAPTPEKPVI